MSVKASAGRLERRDPRHKVILPARLRAGGFPVDMCIRDVSARGLCAVAAEPPERGTIVEVVGLPFPVVAMVVWTDERRFGLAFRGRIDPSLLIATRGEMPDFLDREAKPSYADSIRTIDAAGERSRQIGGAIQFLLLALGAASGAAVAAGAVHQALSASTQVIGSALGAKR